MSTMSDKHLLERSLYILENRVKDPSYLLSLWKLSGSWHSYMIPAPEIVSPWWKGLFDENT